VISSGLHTFWKSTFQTKHENSAFVCKSKYSLELFRIFLVAHIFTALGSCCKVSIFSCHFADGWESYEDRHWMGHYSCMTARIWKQHALVLQAECLTKVHFTDLASNLICCCCSRANPQLQATGISAWVKKQCSSLTVPPAHNRQPSFTNTGVYFIRLQQGNSSTLPS